MNLKQLSLAALASMALFACSNDESLGGSDEWHSESRVYETGGYFRLRCERTLYGCSD